MNDSLKQLIADIYLILEAGGDTLACLTELGNEAHSIGVTNSQKDIYFSLLELRKSMNNLGYELTSDMILDFLHPVSENTSEIEKLVKLYFPVDTGEYKLSQKQLIEFANEICNIAQHVKIILKHYSSCNVHKL